MAATKTKTAKKPAKATNDKNGTLAAEPTDVLTLAEAAAYLRVSESDLLQSVSMEGLPGRKIGAAWRFLKSSLQDWLKGPRKKTSKEVLLDMAGKFKDDPYLEEITREAYRKRGRPITEDGE
jgi:excisionase family DNA binding protein